MANSFSNSFVRQLGRECAHDTYNTLTSYDSELKKVEDTFITKFVWYHWVWLVFTSFLGLFFPPLMAIPLIRGIKRAFGKTIKGLTIGTFSISKADGRCRGGRRYCGSHEGYVDVKKSKDECTKEQLRTARIYGWIEIVYSLVVWGLLHMFWVYAGIIG